MAPIIINSVARTFCSAALISLVCESMHAARLCYKPTNLLHDEFRRLCLPSPAFSADDAHLVLLALHHGVEGPRSNAIDVWRQGANVRATVRLGPLFAVDG